MQKRDLIVICLFFCLWPVFALGSCDTVQVDEQGAIIRFNTAKPQVYLIFSADEHFEGASFILKTLQEKNVKASFFLTGRCLRNPSNRAIVKNIVQQGHYLGPHSDAHLLYNDWEKRDSLLVDRALFESDLLENIRAVEAFGVDRETIKWFLPPYEWYNRQIVEWSREMGLQVISFTPAIGTNADYTTPDMTNYRTSADLIEGLWCYEKSHKYGLNGAIVLIHPGVHPKRTDKFYSHLHEIIDALRASGYGFGKLGREPPPGPLHRRGSWY